ncbi:hypothetical protein NHQ30_003416 [Ciborinia camelliae]|nr:hypothetical protein NHQ30_003416 [Ciborinia camelliae]
MESTSFEAKGENWEIYKDAFAPQPSGKIRKAWERAPVTSHAPRLHGQKIWKKRGGLRAVGENKENYNDAFLELEKEGAGARKKPRVMGNKEDISRAKWHEGKDERDAWDENLVMGMGSPRKNMLGSPDKLQVVPRKRTNANLVITPRKPLRQMLLGGEGKSLNMDIPLSPVKGEELSGSPARMRKEARRSIRKSVMPVDDAQMVEGKHHVRHTSLVFDFEMNTEEKEMESKQELEQSPKKTPKRQSLRRSMRGRVSEPVQISEQASAKINELQNAHTGTDSAPMNFNVKEDLVGAMKLDSKEDGSFEHKMSLGTELTPSAKSSLEQDKFSISQVELVELVAAVTESAQNQSEDAPTQNNARGVKQRRTSSRRSTRQSDRLHLESTAAKLNVEGAEATVSNASTADIRDPALETLSQNTGDYSNSTMTSTTNLVQEEVSDATIEDLGARQGESSDVKISTPVEKVNHIVDELIEKPVSTNVSSVSVEPQVSMLHSPTENSSAKIPANVQPQQALSDFEDMQVVNESPTARVAPFEESGDEDMDDSTSELPEILLEPTINVANLGLSGFNESFDINTNDTQNVVDSDPIEDPESFDLMPITGANRLPTDLESDVTSDGSSTRLATNSEVDDIFSSSATSSFENDDTDMLRQFLDRVKADKAAKAAAPAPKKRKSLPHSPLRIPLGDIMNAEASSPVQAPKDEFDVSVPAILSPTRKSRSETQPPIDEEEVEPKSIRRSGRTRPPAPKIPLPAPSSIPVRRLGGQDGDATVTLKQSFEKELAALTRVNTRKNKAGAVFPEVLLAKRANEKENPAKRQKELKEMFDEKVRREKRGKDKTKKTVVWAEEIAQYQILEKKEKKTMDSRRVNRDGERIVDESKNEERGKIAEAKEKKGRVKIPTASSSRTSKIAVGIPTAHGTPAKKKRLVK